MKTAIFYIILIAAAVQAAPMVIDIPDHKIGPTAEQIFTNNPEDK